MLLLQRRSSDDIARLFGVTVRTVTRWRAKLRERVAADFKARTPSDAASEQLANLKRTKSMAWQQAALCADPLDKYRWVTLTVKCESEITAIYEKMKMYRAVEAKRDNAQEKKDGTTDLASIAESFLTGGYAGAKKEQAGPETSSDPDSDLYPAYDEEQAGLGF